MKLAIIGHRGVGKSSLALRLKKYYATQNRAVRVFDLDDEIESRMGENITKIFSRGEGDFRELEQKTFRELARESTQKEIVIVTGAGFVPSEKFDFKFLWVRRPTDGLGRIFNDRPRLDLNLSPFEEYLSRYPMREKKYMNLADDVLMLSEGFDFANLAEETYFSEGAKKIGGIFTLFERHLANIPLQWGFDFFELRDDLLNKSQMDEVLSKIPHAKIIYSFRKDKDFELVKKFDLKFDWPADFGACPLPPFVSSYHIDERDLKRVVTNSHSHTKLAVKIETFTGLLKCHEWQRQNPDRRSFLPMSHDGRWCWYRLLHPQFLNFIRIDDGSAPDQPTVLETLRRRELATIKHFGAVLGHPVSHSRSPAEHYEFFKARSEAFFAIDVTRENFQEAIGVLEKLGMREAAVTSPLKELAFEISKNDAQEFRAVNTLKLKEQWLGTNTDIEGLRAVASYAQERPVAVWGGGGTLKAMQKVFTDASYFSARTGEGSLKQIPRVVIWAVGRSQFELRKKMPPTDWPIELVIDLNYAENSPGRECALNYKCKYISGLEMFKAQAAKQREFWSSL